MNHSETDPSPGSVVVAALYRFVELADFEALREPLLQLCNSHGLKGTILLASEGINGTVSGSRAGIDALLAYLHAEPRFSGLSLRESRAGSPPFHRMKVKLKREIVTMGEPTAAPAVRTGTHVDPATWNALIQDPEVLVLDTRNEYETAIGQFENAVAPHTRNFRDFPAYARKAIDPGQVKRVAMYCTGGIRCEKASAYLLAQGVEQVYQLEGGILRYLQDMAPEQSLWQGECFVFDDRVSVDTALEPGNHVQCYACRRPLSQRDTQSEHYAPGVCCAHCFEQLSDAQRAGFAERRRQVLLAQARGEQHIGQPMDSQTGCAGQAGEKPEDDTPV